MTRRLLAESFLKSLAFAATTATVLGCQLVAGIEDRAEDTVKPGCALPAGTEHLVRVANLRPSAEAIELCIKPSDDAKYKRPLFHDSGLSCPTGASFKQVTGVFSAPADTLDIRVFPAGTAKCNGTPIVESRVALAAGGVTTLAVLGGGSGVPVQVRALPERSAAAAGAYPRFVNAVSGIGNLLFGVANEPRLPATMAYLVSPNAIPFGATLPAGPTRLGSVDANGYLEQTVALALAFAAAREGSNDALMVTTATPATPWSMFAVGDASDRLYPIRALVCADSPAHDPFVPCTETDPPSLSVDAFSTGLIGLFAVAADERRARLPAAVAARSSDLMCITEVGDPNDRKRLIDAAKATFPFSMEVDSNLDTPFDDPRDLNGNVPPPPTTAPCAGHEAELDALLACGREKCSTIANDGSGRPSTGVCLSTNCVGFATPLIFSQDLQARRCVACAQTGFIASESWDDNAQNCKTNPKAGYAFRGSTPSLILSKFPLTNTQSIQLPATGNRRAVLAATIPLEAGVDIDFYCAHVTASQSVAVPYTGQYGATDGDKGWADEQALQTRQIIDFVKGRSGQRQAIVAGDWQGSIAVAGTDIADRNPDIIRLLRSNFQEATPADYVPQCTACVAPKNPFGKGNTGFFALDVYLNNFQPNAAVEASLFFTEFTVPLADGTLGPLSPYFGFNTRVLRR